MPKYVISKLQEALDRQQGVSLGCARVLIVGLAYKKNVADIRESPALKIIELLEKREQWLITSTRTCQSFVQPATIRSWLAAYR
jgi:UDP-N-acetyl-D-mannosaminuronate dehydrogenase